MESVNLNPIFQETWDIWHKNKSWQYIFFFIYNQYALRFVPVFFPFA